MKDNLSSDDENIENFNNINTNINPNPQEENMPLIDSSSHASAHEDINNINNENEDQEGRESFSNSSVIYGQMTFDRQATETFPYVPENIISQFIQTYIIFFIILFLEILVPEILMYCTKKTVDYADIYSQNWFVMLIFIPLLIIIILLTFFLKKYIVKKNLNIMVPIFVIYIFLIVLIFIFVSFNSCEVMLSLVVISLFSCLFLFAVIKNSFLFKRRLLMFSINVFCILLGFILFCIFSGQKIIACFLYLTSLMILGYYIIYGLKFMYIDMVYYHGINYRNGVPLLVVALGMINSNVDIFIAPFRIFPKVAKEIKQD